MTGGRSGYGLLYRLHFRPWEFDPTPPELIEVAGRLGGGRALELGCGTGRQAVELAARGWEVTGVDYIPKAIEQARARATQQNTAVRFLVGDVTRVDELALGGPFDLVFDNKCLHGLSAAGRQSYARALANTCRPGATFLLAALPPGRGRRWLHLPAGVDRADIQREFGGSFELQRYKAGGGGPFSPAFYEMVRRPP